MYHRTSTKVGIGIGTLGVAVTFLTTSLLVLVPQELLTPTASSAYIETWSRPIMTIGQGLLTYGIPLASATLAYYLTTKNHSVKDVVTGFVVGGCVLVVGDALLGVTVVHFFADDSAIDRSLLGHVLRNITLGGGLVVGAGIGTLGAALKDRF